MLDVFPQETGPLTGLKFTNQTRLACQGALRICPSVLRLMEHILSTTPSSFIGNQTQVLRLSWQALDWLNSLPSPGLFTRRVRRLRHEECHEFEDSLSYIVSSSPEWATERVILCYFGISQRQLAGFSTILSKITLSQNWVLNLEVSVQTLFLDQFHRTC